MPKNWKLIEKSKIKDKVSDLYQKIMTPHTIYILLVQVYFFCHKEKSSFDIVHCDQKAYVLPHVNACLAIFECKISKFVNILFKTSQFCRIY